MWYWEGQFGKLQQKLEASGADNWAVLGRGYDFTMQGCLSSWAAFFIEFVSPMHFSALHRCMWNSFLFPALSQEGLRAETNSSLSSSHIAEKILLLHANLYSLSSTGSCNNAAVTAVVIQPMRQNPWVWINSRRIPEIFPPMSYKKREHSHGAVLSFWKGSICRTKYRNSSAGWVKGKKMRCFLWEICAVEEASVYLCFPTLVCCDKEKKGRHARSLVKFIRGENKTKSRSNRKSFIAGSSMRLAGFEM